jgi:threonine aldolase
MNSSRTGGVIDLREDWAAPPTEAMRKAMAEAEVGDDNLREDPTVRRLEALVAERFDREAALFVPSGTMGNLVSILAHPNHGDEIVVGDAAHTFIYEVGGACGRGRQPVTCRVSASASAMWPAGPRRGMYAGAG